MRYAVCPYCTMIEVVTDATAEVVHDHMRQPEHRNYGYHRLTIVPSGDAAVALVKSFRDSQIEGPIAWVRDPNRDPGLE